MPYDNTRDLVINSVAHTDLTTLNVVSNVVTVDPTVLNVANAFYLLKSDVPNVTSLTFSVSGSALFVVSQEMLALLAAAVVDPEQYVDVTTSWLDFRLIQSADQYITTFDLVTTSPVAAMFVSQGPAHAVATSDGVDQPLTQLRTLALVNNTVSVSASSLARYARVLIFVHHLLIILMHKLCLQV